jgi:large exoprotein involved in heme utilization and adhesion
VGLVPLPQGWSFGYGATLGFRDITLQAAASLDATGLAGGPVQVQGRRVSLQTGSTINSGTLGAISGAPVTVRGSEAISLEQTFTPNPLVGGITTFGSDTASGNAGDIHIATPNLSLVDGLIGTGHVGLGANGNVWVNAGQIFVRNQSLGPIPLASIAGIFSTTLGREAVSGGNLQVTSDQITLLDGGMISTGTFGRGDSGNIQITANRLDVIGGFAPQRLSSGVSTEVLVGSAQGNGGDIEINASQIRLLNGGTITSATSGQGDAGNIRIQAQSLEIAGQLPFLDFRNQIAFSQISASADPPPMLLTPPPAASLNQPPLFSLLPIGPTTNGAAGSLDLNADKITLRDGGRIVVNHLSDSTNPANIYLTANTLVLRNGSSISTDSRGNAVGGNIDLTTQFLVAVGNSDITANATNNFGGRVTVRAKSVLGTAVRPFLTPESDITASSSLGADFAGSVQLTTLGLDPSQGTTPLTADLLDPNQQVSDRCGTVQSGEFVVTGRGGVPSTPMSPGDRPWQDLRAPAAIATAPPSLTAQSPTSSLQEAGLWTLDAQGQIELIANRGSRDPGNASCLTRVTSGSSNTRLQSLQSKNHSPVGLGR